jgi:putative DNA primase/helicase
VPEFKIIVLCNGRPVLDAYDEALKCRIKLIPFDHVVPAKDRNSNLEVKIKREAPGILNWLLVGTKTHYRHSICVPQKVSAATRQYLYDNDNVHSLLKDEATKDPDASVPIGEIYDAYIQYCSDEAIISKSKNKFNVILKKMRFDPTRNNSTRRWIGLSLKTDDDAFKQWHFPSLRGDGGGILFQ